MTSTGTWQERRGTTLTLRDTTLANGTKPIAKV